MPSDLPAAAPESVFAIAYQEFGGSRYNHDFRGKGTLTIRAAGPTFVFSGTKREMLSSRREGEIAFAADQIWNVQVAGRSVQFATRVGASGSKGQPFVFFGATPEEAAAIGAALPQAQEADFVAGREFAHKLAQLHGPANPWTSVTNLIVATNVAVFVLMGLAGAGWIDTADMMPYVRYGANRADVTTDGEWWRLVTSLFLHYGVLHLVLNMWALLQAGHLVERLFGRALYALAYFGSGIAGSLATLLWHRKDLVWSAGASGAVFGVYGAMLGYMLREKHALPKSVFQPLLKSTLAFAGYNLLWGLIRPGIDNSAHLGGLAGGIGLGWLLALPVDGDARSRLTPGRFQLGLAAVALVVAAGVTLTPRFDYRLTDELAWHDANQAPTAREPEIVQHRDAALKNLSTETSRAAAGRWLADEAIPFYTHWRDDLRALPLAPGRRTMQHRDALVNILDLKVTAYEHLRTALRRNDPAALRTLRDDEQQVAAAVAKLARQGK